MNDYIYFEVLWDGVTHRNDRDIAYNYKKGAVYKVPRSYKDFTLRNSTKELSPLDVMLLRKRGVRVYDLLTELKRVSGR